LLTTDLIYNWFTEGFDTADLKDAKAVPAAKPTAASDGQNSDPRLRIVKFK
jgi:hypothetical protein